MLSSYSVLILRLIMVFSCFNANTQTGISVTHNYHCVEKGFTALSGEHLIQIQGLQV